MITTAITTFPLTSENAELLKTVWKTDIASLEKLHKAIRKVLSGELNLSALHTRLDITRVHALQREEVGLILNSVSFKVFEYRYYQTNHVMVKLADLVEYFCVHFFYER